MVSQDLTESRYAARGRELEAFELFHFDAIAAVREKAFHSAVSRSVEAHGHSAEYDGRQHTAEGTANSDGVAHLREHRGVRYAWTESRSVLHSDAHSVDGVRREDADGAAHAARNEFCAHFGSLIAIEYNAYFADC